MAWDDSESASKIKNTRRRPSPQNSMSKRNANILDSSLACQTLPRLPLRMQRGTGGALWVFSVLPCTEGNVKQSLGWLDNCHDLQQHAKSYCFTGFALLLILPPACCVYFITVVQHVLAYHCLTLSDLHSKRFDPHSRDLKSREFVRAAYNYEHSIALSLLPSASPLIPASACRR